MNYSGITSLLEPELENKHIYRILNFDYLAEWFETGKLPLLSPAKWEDPFEKLFQQAVYPDQVSLNYQRARMYGLCMTMNGISDALWRVYSPQQYGIRIKTTPSIIGEALSNSTELVLGQTYLGKVNYKKQSDLVAHARTIKENLEKNPETKTVAEAMLLKRTAFQHEKEVRIIHLTADSNAKDDLYYFSIDPHKVIQSILVDPRASDVRFKTIKRYFSKVCSYKGSINQSQLYKLPRI
jgi:hypothetical protein